MSPCGRGNVLGISKGGKDLGRYKIGTLILTRIKMWRSAIRIETMSFERKLSKGILNALTFRDAATPCARPQL